MPNLDLLKEWPRYLVSSLLTFAAGFAIIFVMEIDNLTIGSIKDGAFVGAIFAGIRGGIKLLLESFIAWYQIKYGKDLQKHPPA